MIIGIDASRANRSYKTGTEWYSYHLIRELAKLDNQNQYILYSDEPLSFGLVDLVSDNIDYNPDVVFENGYQVLLSPHGNFRGKVLAWPFNFFWTQGRLSLEMFFKRPDILFVPAHALPLIHPKKSVATIHDIGFKRESFLYDNNQTNKPNFLFSLIVKLITAGKYNAKQVDYLDWSTAFALKKAWKIITISEFTKKEIALVYGEEKINKISVIHNGFNDYLYNTKIDLSANKEVFSRYNIKKPYIFYVGRLEVKKNIMNLIQAFYFFKKNNPELKHKLVLAGSHGFGFGDIRKAIDYYGLEKEIILTGWVEEKELSWLMAGAELFVYPSNYEGFGIPLLEAMAVGVPVVASQTASIPEVGADAILYFNQRNPEDMAEKMAEAILNQDLRKTMIAAGLERVKCFSWKKCAQETLDTLLSFNKSYH